MGVFLKENVHWFQKPTMKYGSIKLMLISQDTNYKKQ